MNRKERFRIVALVAVLAVGLSVMFAQNNQRSWLAGDSHIHSHWSPGYDRTRNPPEPITGTDGLYSTPTS